MKAILPNGEEIDPTYHGAGYHGTSLDPEYVFKHGFTARGSDRRLLEHVLNNSQSAFRGTTASANVCSENAQGAVYWAEIDGWVYEIVSACWNVEKELEGRVPTPSGYGNSPHKGELEAAIPGEVRPHQIRMASKVIGKHGRLRASEWHFNKSFRKP
ncbi:hypothetical protein PPUJ20028_46430 [Pseudomonas putida]|uniref:Uncharacterized protein n=1 Tax=Pseudomonas putida TaxID=303 RepID=A0AA37RJT3_PSEPU|nr:hypothetical protein [Pseudomonas putida]GLO16057.1 hypothetical protein PPUJ20028_46430 [Pseudomonas putida]GLO37884.1 hypothetical protein PPUN14671_47210 [Pseudomonas putida]HDS0965095.1 hypothetical protein [Pseudomonas putida]HDS0991477.1 hypothetical protein [Pseudomonas putida]